MTDFEGLAREIIFEKGFFIGFTEIKTGVPVNPERYIADVLVPLLQQVYTQGAREALQWRPIETIKNSVEECQPVLLFDNSENRGTFTGNYFVDPKTKELIFFCYEAGDEWPLYNVTHWMPLPQCP